MPKTKRKASDSAAQRNAESAAIKTLSDRLLPTGLQLSKKRIQIANSSIEPDGVAETQSTVHILEVNAHIGTPKNATINKILRDAFKLVTARSFQLNADWKGKEVYIHLVFLDAAAFRPFDSKSTRSWRAFALDFWGIKSHVVELSSAQRSSIMKAQKQQDLRDS